MTSRRRGMTVLELMLAMMLFGILSAFVFQVMNSVLGLWQTGERRGRGDLVFASAVERFRADLQAMHTGPRGWMVLDSWELRPATEEAAAWRAPRLRFLADGAALSDIDPSGRAAVEILWTLVPEDSTSRFGRLVRLARVEDLQSSLLDEGVFRRAVADGQALVVMDGVLWVEFQASEQDGRRVDRLRIDSHQPYGFPRLLGLAVESVDGNARRKPMLLDDPIDAESAGVRLRGIEPLEVPEYALIGQEWVRVDGRLPKPRFSRRGERGSVAATHAARSAVYFPSHYQADNAIAAGGRRLQ